MRRLTLVALLFVLLLPLTAAAQMAQPAQTQVSVFDTKIVIDEAVSAAREIKSAQAEIDAINAKGNDYGERVKRHNAIYGPGGCKYRNDPSECASWMQEAKKLKEERDALIAELGKARAKKASAESSLAVKLSILKALRILDRLTAWERRVVGCSKLDIETAVGCLNDAWEAHP